MKRRSLTFFLLLVFLMWNVLTYFFIAHRPQTKDEFSVLEKHLASIQDQIKNQADHNERILADLQQAQYDLQGNLRKFVQAENMSTTPAPHRPHPARSGSLLARSANASLIRNTFLYSQQLLYKIPGNVQEPDKIDLPVLENKDGEPVVADPEPDSQVDPNQVPLPVLVIACNRPSVSRNVDQIIRYRTSEERFPIVVSQDCGHGPTADVIRSYGAKVTHLQHPDLSDIPLPKKDQKFKGYYKIARHYKWALNQVFHILNYQAVIIVEDDLDLSPDFFEYMSATYPILRGDPTLWCVSAWNDNGKEGLVMDDPELLYRTDFFPGLGWMLEKKTWLELEDKWPETFWDDWMRHPDQRIDRACIRPEISRSKTFGKIGVSRGQFFDKYLKFIQLNTVFVPFTKKDLSYLKKENYDEMFVKMVYNTPLMTVRDIQQGQRPEETAVHVLYTDKNNYKTQAKALGLMDDLKSGVPRAGYRGIISFMYKGRRIYMTPPPNWTGYDPTWS